MIEQLIAVKILRSNVSNMMPTDRMQNVMKNIIFNESAIALYNQSCKRNRRFVHKDLRNVANNHRKNQLLR